MKYRKFGSVAPPDGSRHPATTAQFAKLTAQEAADQLDGLAATTLPGAAHIQEFYNRQAVAHEMARAEARAASAAQIVQQKSSAVREADN